MPRPKRTEAQINEMRQRILDAAQALIKENGHEALSIRAIAKRMELSPMALYSYFANREALLAGLGERQRERMQARFAAIALEAETGDIREVLREWLSWHAHMSRTHPQGYHFLWVQPITSPEWLAHHHERLHNNLRHLAQLIQLGIERGVFAERDPLLAAGVVLCMVNGPLILYHNGRLPDAALRDQLAQETVNAALSYLCTASISQEGNSLCPQ